MAALQPILGWELGDKRALSLSEEALEEEALSSMAGEIGWGGCVCYLDNKKNKNLK